MLFPVFSRALMTAAAGAVVAAALTACGGATHAATTAPTTAAPRTAAPQTAAPTPAAPAPAAPTPAAPASTSTVTIENFAFTPPAITVKTGATVTWTNKDEEPHSIVSSDEPMHSPTLAGKDDTFAHTFTKPGRYAYNCGIHPFMQGTVEVTA